MTTGYIIFAHGSRIEPANEGVRAVAATFARAGKYDHVAAAFLELGTPDLDGAVDVMAAQGVSRIIVIPYFLTLGTHLERDLPKLVAQAASRHEGIQLSATAPLDGHPALVQILLDRARDPLTG